MRFLIPLLILLFTTSGAQASAAPRPNAYSGRYDLDILGFNDGGPYRLRGAAAEAVLADPGARIYRFESGDWMSHADDGRLVPVTEVTGRFPERSPAELVAVYGVDLNADRVPEMLLVPDAEAIGDDEKRWGPTILGLQKKQGYRPIWAADKLPGERFRLVDIRDLNADGRPEILLSGEAGRSGYYQFHELVAWTEDGFETLPVKHVDSIHYVDLDRDRRIEVVVRQRVGRRGPAYQWTYVDQLMQWTGEDFESADTRYPRYHDEETLPTLVGDLIDHYEAKPAILEEKIEAIETVREQVLKRTKRPSDFDERVVPALAALQKEKMDEARKLLEALLEEYPYDPQVLVGLSRVHAARDDWTPVLESAIRALTVDPRDRGAWWWTGVALVQLEERSSAIASFHNLVRLCGSTEEGQAFLRARRGEPGMEGSLQRAIDKALESFEED
ncbi:MAG: tetratricopeptide repeat protein [Myxococcota bacterium]